MIIYILEIDRLFRIICSMISSFEGWKHVDGITCIYKLMFYFFKTCPSLIKSCLSQIKGSGLLKKTSWIGLKGNENEKKLMDVYKMHIVDNNINLKTSLQNLFLWIGGTTGTSSFVWKLSLGYWTWFVDLGKLWRYNF